MTQHITQEQAETIRENCYAQKNLRDFYHAMMNAAIQHYIDKQAKELPELPEPDKLTTTEHGLVHWHSPALIQSYGDQRAAPAREMAISETVSIAYGYADNLTWNDSFKAEIKALKGK